MAQKRTIDIDINTNADQAAKEFDNLGKATKVANDSLEGLNKTFEEANGDIQPLTARMGEAEDRLYELALAGDTTSKEYQGLLNKVGEYRKVQIQTDLAVDQAAQTFSQKLGTALGGATSGFAAVQGTMALVGGESEALERTLLKVQAAMAIQQGIAGIQDYSKSVGLAGKATKAWGIITGTTTGMFKALRVALIATGIGAIVVLIGTLIANLDKLRVPIDAAIQAFKDLADWIGITSFAEEDAAEQRKQYAETQRQIDEGIAKSREEAHQRRMQQYAEERAASKQGWDDWLEIMKLQGNEERAIYFKREELRGAFWFDATKDISEFTNEELKAYRALLEFEKEVAAFREANAQKRLATKRKIEDLEIKLMDAGLEKELEMNRDSFERQREDITEKGKDKLKLIKLYNELELQEEKRIREKFDVFKLEEFDGEIAQLEIKAIKQIDINKLTNEEIEKQMSESAARQKAIDDKLAADKKANAIAVADANLTIAHESLGAIGELANAFAKDDEKSAKRAFNINKAVGIAQAIVSTAQGIMAQLAVPQDALSGTNFIKAGIVAATGAAQIATISKSKFEGGGGGDTPSVDASAGAAQAPSFNVVGDSGINQLAQLQQAPVQAFVVSGEVTTSQALDRNRVENATL